MKKIYILLIMSAVLFSFYSCDTEEDLRDESVLDIDESLQNELDVWIYENLTKPYNVEVKYKWDDNEIPNSFHVTPPKIEKAKDFLEAYLNLWIKPYEEESIAGNNPDFMYKYMPKLLVLVGTPQYNADGSMTMGMAEGGRKVTIFNVDKFAEVAVYTWDTPEVIVNRKKDAMRTAFHTLHHEFAHIMHQTKFYADEFKEICKGDYTANWMDLYPQDANLKGFITPYSMLNEDEDFVEIVAGMLDRSKYSNEPHEFYVPLMDEQGEPTNEDGNVFMTEWESFLYGWCWKKEYDENWNSYWVRTPEAKKAYEKFTAKVNIVTAYYNEKWGIDLYNLQKRIDTAVSNLVIE
ncbi:hypothetical protein DF185_22755 [Marinifilum breve]|uniref:Substrate import-associated zinc metallohydrolase lipoprotein n=1 Tax=Marinifilum breve TaxID=2184082 RepID=A0A2V3ZUP8_9BACT|nr:substrate import-associated zinc metallohydrolase lipoprotein [Marinifilum breve]PXX95014.1 hypothetical protein DF185_22755 [Marinifilum breve]